ncbi:MAG TPA: glycolate oxidase subunit GlcF [Solirubrobacteraceae bacterium]|nr:glycolate oxidase subunit GlcF [Solirubrobacteraceae bacterium]
MQHAIPVNEIGPLGPAMAAPIEACVHCGFCLPTCPTYAVLGEEMDSPRGRIFLMKEVLEGKLELEEALPYVDNCLGCLACQTACPSGVEYGELITPFRTYAEQHRERSPLDRGQRAAILQTLTHPRWFRPAVRLGALVRPLRSLLPKSLRGMVDLVPPALPKTPPLSEVYPATGPRRARVALLTGCVQHVLEPDINLATLRVLSRNGVETVVPSAQGCCGALAIHGGDFSAARPLARANLRAFPSDVDAIVTNAAGCGSGMKDYGLLFTGEPDHAEASALAGRVRDVASLLDELGMVDIPAPAAPVRIAYHDACHLAHAQHVREAPRRLLGSIPGVEVLTPAEWQLCCGSAGTYNLEKPEIADALGARKAAALRATGATFIASGNIGCLTQLRRHLDPDLPVMHTVQILDRAYARAL